MINIITSDHKVRYVFDVIFSIFKTDYTCNCQETCALTVTYDEKTPVIAGKHIHIKKLSFWDNYKKPASLPELPLSYYKNVPVIYGEPDVKYENDRIIISIDIIASIFFMVTRYEEFLQPSLKDQHGRFPAVESIAYKENFLDRPVVNEYIEIFLDCLTRLLPDLRILKPDYKLCVTHDVDDLYKYRKFPLKNLAADLLLRNSPAEFFRTVKNFFRSRNNIFNDPYYSTLHKFVDSEQKKFSIYYFLIGGKSLYDNRYSCDDPNLKNFLQVLEQKKIVYGLHASYEAYNNEQVLQNEKNVFERLVGNPPENIRNHFLRFDVSATWQIQDKLGFKYDSTCGFADHEGFRCGICHPFNVYDLVADKTLSLKEIPLIIMDGTLRDYRKMSPEEAIQVINSYKRVCKKYNGIFNILWHNSFFYYSPCWEKVYMSSIYDEKNKKILIITRNFLPYYQSLGGVLRVLKTAEYLYKKGFEIHILAAKGIEISFFGYEDILRNYNLHYFNDVLKKIENRVYLSSLDSQGLDVKKSNLKFKIKKFVSYFMLPDQTVLSVKNAYKQAKKLILEHDIENVIISSPPQSVLLAGHSLKKHFRDKINLIIDYRDSWNTTDIFRKKNPVMFAICKRMERKILKIADRFVYISKPMLDKIMKMYKIDDLPSKSHLVMNGYKSDKLVFPDINQSCSGKIKIGYFGALSDSPLSFRDPTLLFEFIQDYYPDKFEIFIYGSQNVSKKYPFVKSFSSVNHDEALQIMKEMDLLFLLHSKREGADEVITGKFFDYLTTGRPLLVYGPLNMEAARLVRENQFGYDLGILPEDKEYLQKSIDNIIHQFKSNSFLKYSPSMVAEFSFESQFAKLLGCLR